VVWEPHAGVGQEVVWEPHAGLGQQLVREPHVRLGQQVVSVHIGRAEAASGLG